MRDCLRGNGSTISQSMLLSALSWPSCPSSSSAGLYQITGQCLLQMVSCAINVVYKSNIIRAMFDLPILRNYSRMRCNHCRYCHAFDRSSSHNTSPHPTQAKADPNGRLWHGHFCHRRCHPHQSLLSCSGPDLLCLYELVLPRNDSCHPRHQPASHLVSPP